jgi:hypothetical protein
MDGYERHTAIERHKPAGLNRSWLGVLPYCLGALENISTLFV